MYFFLYSSCSTNWNPLHYCLWKAQLLQLSIGFLTFLCIFLCVILIHTTMQHSDPHHGGLLRCFGSTVSLSATTKHDCKCCHFRLVSCETVVPPRASPLKATTVCTTSLIIIIIKLFNTGFCELKLGRLANCVSCHRCFTDRFCKSNTINSGVNQYQTLLLMTEDRIIENKEANFLILDLIITQARFYANCSKVFLRLRSAIIT